MKEIPGQNNSYEKKINKFFFIKKMFSERLKGKQKNGCRWAFENQSPRGSGFVWWSFIPRKIPNKPSNPGLFETALRIVSIKFSDRVLDERVDWIFESIVFMLDTRSVCSLDLDSEHSLLVICFVVQSKQLISWLQLAN